MSDDAPAIQVAALRKSFGPFVAIDTISCEIRRGEVVALLGPNGAGKTTMMRILAGFLAPTQGTARVAGFDVQTDRLAAAARLGYLPENGPLYPDMTPVGLLRFFGEALGLAPDRLAARLDDVTEQCGLQEILERPIGKLSKGLRQRVGLAVALLHDPDVLIMDEPTSGLDPNQIRRFRGQVQQLREKKTLLISTHILHEMEMIADRVLLVSAGRLVFDGRPDEMRAQGSLEECFYRLTHAAC